MSTGSPPNRRARKILAAIVSEFLNTGEAVGSRTVSRRHSIQLSPATVRNVMADLEEMGLLEQPHTSAGRVPTESGLRFFIDSLLKVRTLSVREKEAIRSRFGVETLDVDKVFERTSKTLSEITHHAGIVLAPNPALQRFRHIEFVALRGGKFLCVLVTSEGRIENKLIHIEFDVDERQLERIHNYLERLLRGLTLDEVRERVLTELGEEKNQYDEMVSAALRMSKAALDGGNMAADVIVAGGANLIDLGRVGDRDDLERMRDLLGTLEDKEVLAKLLDRTLNADGIQVFLGAETALGALGESSVVAMPYGPNDRPVGAIAVIGPMRMNYGKVMSVVDFTADLVSRMMAEF
jgi:heat-inducible transcriptional repressor